MQYLAVHSHRPTGRRYLFYRFSWVISFSCSAYQYVDLQPAKRTMLISNQKYYAFMQKRDVYNYQTLSSCHVCCEKRTLSSSSVTKMPLLPGQTGSAVHVPTRDIVFVAITCPWSLRIPGNSPGSFYSDAGGIYQSNHHNIAWPAWQYCSSPGKAAPTTRTENRKGANRHGRHHDAAPVYIPACGVSPAKKAIFFFLLRNPSFSMDHALFFCISPVIFFFWVSFSPTKCCNGLREQLYNNRLFHHCSFNCQIRLCVCRDYQRLSSFGSVCGSVPCTNGLGGCMHGWFTCRVTAHVSTTNRTRPSSAWEQPWAFGSEPIGLVPRFSHKFGSHKTGTVRFFLEMRTR